MKLDPRVIQHEPLGFHDYNCLQMNAFAVVSDSGTLPEESSLFTSVGHPFPAICIRTSTERVPKLSIRLASSLQVSMSSHCSRLLILPYL